MIRCPIVNKEIDIGDCSSIVDVVDGCIKEKVLSKDIVDKENWKEICINCKYHNQ